MTIEHNQPCKSFTHTHVFCTFPQIGSKGSVIAVKIFILPEIELWTFRVLAEVTYHFT